MRRACSVERSDPFRQPHEPVEGILELVTREVEPDPGLDRVQKGGVLGPGGEACRVEVAVHDRVLEVVHRVGDVVGEVHHLGLDAAYAPGRFRAQPAEHVLVVGIDAELEPSTGIGKRMRGGPRVLAGRVQARAGQIEAETAPGLVDAPSAPAG